MSSLAFLPVTAASTVVMSKCYSTPQGLSNIQDQKSLTLQWHLYLVYGMEHVTCLFTYTHNEYFCIEWMWLCTPVVTSWVRQLIVDAQLTLTLQLTLEPYQQSLGAQQFHTKRIQSLWTANISSLCIMICIQKFWTLSVSEPPVYTSCECWMTYVNHVFTLSAGN